jgi:hypothetical protein
MIYFTLRHTLALLALAGIGLPYTAQAQYAWVDERGAKQYSDMPPPASVPANRIIKQPRSPVSTTATGSTETITAPTPEMTAAEKNAEFRKRKIALDEKERKASDDAKRAAEKAKYCEQAREYNRTLESGVRISRMDKNGERAFLTDEQRMQEQQEAKRMLEDCK